VDDDAIADQLVKKRYTRILEPYHVDVTAHRLGEERAKLERVQARGVDGEVHVRIGARGPSGFGAEKKSKTNVGPPCKDLGYLLR
jgi:hypothetical protein